MLTLQDCIGLCGLSAAEVEAIAWHEHVPETVAAEIASYLARAPNGPPVVRRVIMDDIAAARRAGDMEKLARLRLTLRHFLRQHPGCACATEQEAAELLRPARGGRAKTAG